MLDLFNRRQVFGFHPVRELLRHRPQEVLEVVCSAQRGKRRSEIEALCERHGVGFRPVPATQLDQMAAGQTHNGFVAAAAEQASATPNGPDSELLVLVEDIQDARNLGALLRVCEGAGVGNVMIRDRGSAPLTAGAIKTSAGAAEWQSFERITNSSLEIERLKAEGFWVYGADAAGKPPWEIELTGKVLFCVGGESGGLRERTRKNCDELVGLPMRGRVGSLNLATAAAALLYEAIRQRSTSSQ